MGGGGIYFMYEMICIDFTSFYNFSIGFWKCSSVVFLVFYFFTLSSMTCVKFELKIVVKNNVQYLSIWTVYRELKLLKGNHRNVQQILVCFYWSLILCINIKSFAEGDLSYWKETKCVALWEKIIIIRLTKMVTCDFKWVA